MKPIAYREMYENELLHAWYVATRKLMINFLNKHLKKNAKILDAGCGTGGTMIYLQRAGFKNITGVDNSKEALKFTQKRRLTNIKLASVDSLPFAKNYFDAVICLDVLYHEGVDPKKAIFEFRRVLKSDGILYLEEPSYNWIKSKHDSVIETGRRYTTSSIENLVKSGNFKILKLSYFNSILSIPIFIKRLKDKVSSPHTESSDVYRLPALVNSVMLSILEVEGLLVKNLNLPFGLSVICFAKK